MKMFRVMGVQFAAVSLIASACAATPQPGAMRVPAPTFNEAAATPGLRTAVFAGGCFWGIQSVFQHVRGVTATRAGYDGGARDTAEYETVGSGTTGHAESVAVTYDPTQVTYGTLLQIFFSVALDPTQKDGQFPDDGSQYRSVLFTRSDEQAREARDYIAQLNAQHVFPRPIATEVVKDRGFYTAEAYHQNFADNNPGNLYISTYDAPKVDALKALFATDYRARPVLTLADGG